MFEFVVVLCVSLSACLALQPTDGPTPPFVILAFTHAKIETTCLLIFCHFLVRSGSLGSILCLRRCFLRAHVSEAAARLHLASQSKRLEGRSAKRNMCHVASDTASTGASLIECPCFLQMLISKISKLLLQHCCISLLPSVRCTNKKHITAANNA